jgi:uncharacterized membrane protein
MDSTYFDWQELLALVFFLSCWVGYARYAEHEDRINKSLLAITNGYRTQWMREMMRRDNRSVDAIMVGNLQRSITFFASTTIFIVAGLMTMLSYHERADAIVGTIPFAKASSLFFWEMKIFLLVIMFIYAFFKYTWSLRQYNYASIFIGACPPCNERPEDHEMLAQRGGYLVGNAARHFNNALRAYYFALAALAWFIHPYLFMAVTALVVCVIYRREYRSGTLKNLVVE